MGLIGSLLYAFAVEGWMALIGRICDGIWAGALNSTIRTYITKSTKKENIGRVTKNIQSESDSPTQIQHQT